MHVKLCLVFPFGSLVPLSRPHSHIQNAGCSFLQAEGTVEMQVKCFFWRPRAQVPNLASWEPVARQFIGLHARQENIIKQCVLQFLVHLGLSPLLLNMRGFGNQCIFAPQVAKLPVVVAYLDFWPKVARGKIEPARISICFSLCGTSHVLHQSRNFSVERSSKIL